MADNAIKYGFRWFSAIDGSKNMPQPEEVIVASGASFDVNGGAQNVSLRIGDPVTRISTGGVTLCDGSEGAGGGVALYGIVVGVLPYYDSTRGQMTPSNALPDNVVYSSNLERQSKVLVVRAEAGLWEIDCDDTAAAYDTLAEYQAFQGENCDHILTGASGETSAKPRLDISGHGTATAQWRLVRVSPTAANQDFAGNYVKFVVRVNECQAPGFVATGSGVGI